MTKTRMSLLVFGALLIALITLMTVRRSPSPFPVNIGTLENGDTRITLRTPEELARLLSSSGGAHDFSKHFTQEDVPELMALLEDPKYVRQWSNAMLMASAVDKQHELQPYLIRYIKWDHGLANFDYSERVVNSFTRFTALAMLGFVADEQGIEFLETVALSNEGLYSVTSDWIHKPIRRPSEDRSNYLGTVRARAALGLVYSKNPSSIVKVEKLHRETVDALRIVLRDHNLQKHIILDGLACLIVMKRN